MGNRSYLMSRRGVLKGLVLSVVPGVLGAAEEKAYDLRNQHVAFQVVIRKGKLVSRRLVNRLADETVDLPLDDFALEFDKGIVLTPSNLSLDDATQNGDQIKLLYSSSASNVEMCVAYHLGRGKHYLRKQIAVRERKPTGLKVMRADLDNWRGVKRHWQSMRADPMRCGSHPIFCETLWAGVEFVAAFNEYDREGFILRSRPGGKPLGPEWLELHSTVVGVTNPNEARESFLQHYIDDIRQVRPRLVACYNSWWSLPEIFKEDEFLALIQAIKQSLYDKHGVFFDFVTADMGWSDPHSIWQVDQKNYPNGLTNVVEVVKSAGGKAGVWMSPSEVYPPVMDYDWAEKNGYVVVRRGRPEKGAPGLSLADPKYRNQAMEQLQRLIKENALGQIKYDGLIAREDRSHHDLLPGDDSVEPLAEYSLELIKASKEANPDLVAEPTYLNSLANYISPWIIKYADVVWGNSGGDCPRGLGPAPDYREAQTSAREYYIFSSLEEIWLPQNALQYFDIVHCDDAGGFPNHAAMAFGRGRFFVSTYLNPKFMSDEDWRIYAGFLRWARKNQSILQNTKVLRAPVERGEPYAYAHWEGTRGLIAVRNPSNESQEYAVDLSATGAPTALADGVAYIQYPHREGIATDLTGASHLRLKLAPWELVFVEIVPRSQLREAVAIDARWYRESNGEMKVSSPDATQVRILLPREGERTVQTKPFLSGKIQGEVLSWSQMKAPRSDWLKQKEVLLPTDTYELECLVSIPAEAKKGTVLFLLEFPGREHYPSTCSCTVNERAVILQERPSEGHVGGYLASANSPWSEVMAHESEWTWYLCEIGSGQSRIKFVGKGPSGHSRIALYVWADWDSKSQAMPTGLICSEPELPQYRDHLARRGIKLAFPVTIGGRDAEERILS